MSQPTLNLDAITYEQLVKAIDYLDKDMDKALALLRPVIVSWDYEADLSAADPFSQMAFQEPFDVIRHIIKSFNAAADRLAENIVIDFKASKWTYNDNRAFMQARVDGKHEKVDAALRRLAYIPGDEQDKPLSSVYGAAIFVAYQRELKKVLTAGN